MRKSLIGILSALLFLSGCVRPVWITVKEPLKMPYQNYEVMFPEGWKQYNQSNDVGLATRDGLPLQQIRITRHEIGEDTPFSHTKKKIQEGILPQELAEVIQDELRSNTTLLNLRFKENSPATISGLPGIKMSYTYQTASDLTQNVDLYSFVTGKSLYLISYTAPARYYFDRDREAFEKTKASFRLTKD